MKMVKMVVISTLVSAVSLTAMASPTGETEIEGYGPGSMPMMQGQGGMPMMRGQQGNMPMMNMMREKQAMMQTHMKTMETRLANIEALLQQLVELQKK